MDWAEHHPHLEVRWTRAADIALPDTYALMRISESAKVSLELKTVWTVDPTWDDDDRLQDLRRRLETIEGGSLSTWSSQLAADATRAAC